MATSSTQYSSHMKQFNLKVSELKSNVSSRESKLLTTAKRDLLAPHKLSDTKTNPMTPIKPLPTDIGKGGQIIYNQQSMQEFLKTNQDLRDLLQQKSKYTELEYEKQLIKWKDQKLKMKKDIDSLKQNVSQKDQKIINLIETVSLLKAQEKKLNQKCDQQMKQIVKVSTLKQQYLAQNVQVKLKNKNLSADIKVAIKNLDKFIKNKNEQNQKSAQQLFEEQERRVIESLYNKCMPAFKPENPQILPSQTHELSNKIKFDRLFEEYGEYRRESTIKMKKLYEENQLKRTEIESNKSRIRMLEDKIESIQNLRNLEKSEYSQRQIALKIMEENHQAQHQYIQKLEQAYKMNKNIPRFKQKIGTIISLKSSFSPLSK